MKEAYQLTKQELFRKYGSANGLSEETAKQRLQENGENVLEEKKKKSICMVFLEQFADFLVVILMVAAVISILSGNMESSIVIFAVIILNAVLGTVQYSKAEKSLDALKELSAPRAKVLRDGMKKEIPSKEIVPGDVLFVEAGDMIVADGRIIAGYSLQVNESSLTGESTNVEKKGMEIPKETALGDRCNMVFSGSIVTYGRADILVTETGMHTEMGKIATLMNDTKRKKTPLQVSLDEFSKKLAMVIMIICVIVFGLRSWQGEAVLDSLMFAVALAVAAIPEALGSIVTIVQAMGTRKMAADNAIIKELKAVESLGCVSVICSDKTGTLTQNKMTVTEVYLDGKTLLPENLDVSVPLHQYFLYDAVLNNDSTVNSEDSDKEIGDPTETCLLIMAKKAGLEKSGMSLDKLRNKMPRLEEIPFDSDRKIMSTKYRIDGNPIVFTKGAVDVLLDRVDSIWLSGGVRHITTGDKENILRQNRMFSENGQRVLAFAYKQCGEEETLGLDSEYGYTFLGLAAIIDPPREESAVAVSDAIQAGIKPVMITGDHKVTATAIAKQIGIYKDGDRTVTGQELDRMTEEELNQALESISVYARVSPENKIRIVDAWQRKGKIVAMTGDGVNDAPALKKADIGVAMGITGTEVSKDASAMILADDNFATIIHAVLNGRNVYRNIMNAIQFLLSGNMAAILVVLFCTIMALDTPFEPVHLLFINLVTDSLPALAIGMEPSDKMLLKNKPRNPKEGILTTSFYAKIFGQGILIAAVTQVGYFMGLCTDSGTARTMAFATLTLARLFHGFNCRSNRSLFQIGIRSNKWSVVAFAVGILLLGIILFAPFMQGLFVVSALSAGQIAGIVLLAVMPTVFIQVGRKVKF